MSHVHKKFYIITFQLKQRSFLSSFWVTLQGLRSDYVVKKQSHCDKSALREKLRLLLRWRSDFTHNTNSLLNERVKHLFYFYETALLVLFQNVVRKKMQNNHKQSCQALWEIKQN